MRKAAGKLRRHARRLIRHGIHHVRVLSRHPDVRQAAKSLAVIGGAHALTHAIPARYIRYHTIKHWRANTEHGTPQRQALLTYMHSHLSHRRLVREGLKTSSLGRFHRAARRRTAQARLRRLLDKG